MNKEKLLGRQRLRRRHRVRKRIRGTSDQPRLSVFRSNRNISCQLIDDLASTTMAAASTLEAPLRAKMAYGGNKTAARLLGKTLAERAVAKGIRKVRFDRGSYRYHGRVAEVAEGAREGGLEF